MEADGLFAARRTVGWGDCDPAGILYTPRAGHFAMETLEGFFREVLGVSFAELPARGLGAPVLSLSVDFKLRLPVDTEVRLPLRIERIGSKSLTYDIACVSGEEPREHFRASLTNCFLSLEEKRAVPPPEALRATLERYAAVAPVGA